MTRIAMVTDSFLPRTGGMELHVRDLSLNLARAGHDVHIVSPFDGPGPLAGVTVERLPVLLWPRFAFAWTPSAVYRLEALLSDRAFDVVHHHVSIFSPLAVASICQCLKLGIPTVVTGHSLWREYARALGWLDRIISWSSTPLVISGVSKAVAADIAPFAGVHPIELLPNGIDAEFWKAPVQNSPANSGPVRIVSVLRLARRKRPRVLLDIAARLLRELPADKRFTMQIVGDGDERSHLERLIADRELSNHVTLRGALSRVEIRDLFRDCDLFVLPTAEEAFGIAALEARSAGLPVVAMDTGGVKEIIAHGVEGLLASTDAELVAHTATLICDASLRERMAAHNFRTFPRDCWPQVILQHERVYALAEQRMRERALSRNGATMSGVA